MTTRPVLLLLVLLPLFAAAEGMYKWVDEKGVTHYSESPPPDDAKGKKATKIDIKPNGPSGPVKDNWKERVEGAREKQIQSNEEQAKQQKADAQEKARRDMACRQALQQVSTLQQTRPVYTTNDKGERVYMEDTDRAQRIADAQERMRKNCEQ